MTWQSDKFKGRWNELEDFYSSDKFMNKQYSFWKSVGKSVASFLLFLIPVLLTSFPTWANLTVGAVLVGVANAIKFYLKKA